MSYVSPPESRSRVENIKKRFEITNNDLSTPITNNSRFTKTPVHRNLVGNRVQSNNGVKSNISPRKKILHTAASDPIDIPEKCPNPSPTIKTPQSVPIKAEKQLINPGGRGHIRRSPAFRCDKIVRGRNVTGQISGIRDKTRSVVGNRVKLFEDGQNVTSVVKKLNISPLDSSDTAYVANKSPRAQINKQLALEDNVAAKRIGSVTNSGNTVTTIYVTQNFLVNSPSTSTNFGDEAVLSSATDLEKSEAVRQHNLKLPKLGVEYASVSNVKGQVSASFHKYEHHRVKLPLENIQLNANSKTENSTTLRTVEYKEVELIAPPEEKEVNNCEITNGIKSEKRQALQEMSQNEVNSSGITLTDTLKAALRAPLPIGPPPKKPPRTFAHNTPSPDNAGENNISMPSATTTSAIEAESNKNLPQHVKVTKSVSEKTNIEKSIKPVRSKTESQIMLRKLESVLLSHEQSTGGVVLRPKSPMVRRNVEDKAIGTYSEPDSKTGRSIGRVGPLPSLPLESELLNSHDICADGDNVRFGSCLNFSCVSADSNNPLYSQIHFYEKVPEKQSEFFVESPNICSLSKRLSKPYGTLLHCRSRSEEHIYAEPFDYFNRVQNYRSNIEDWKTQRTVMKSGESAGGLPKIGESVEIQNISFIHPENIISKTGTLHYLVSGKKFVGTVNFAV